MTRLHDGLSWPDHMTLRVNTMERNKRLAALRNLAGDDGADLDVAVAALATAPAPRSHTTRPRGVRGMREGFRARVRRVPAGVGGVRVSLHVFADLIQGTAPWMEARRGIVTASVVGQLVTPKTIKPASNVDSRALTALLASERITGWAEEPYVSHDMIRGSLDEPVARYVYSEHYSPVAEVGLMVRDDWGFKIGYSPDGLVGDDGLIEIKSRKPKEQLVTVVSDEVPAENMAQIQCGLLVSGRAWCDYVSFAGGMPMWRKRVEPDPRWHEAIVAAVEAFEQAAADMLAIYRERTAGLPATERGTYDTDVMV